MIAWLWNVCGEGVSCPYVNKGPKQRLCVSLSQSKKKVSYLRVQPCFGIDSCSDRAAGSTERWASFSRTQRSTRSSLQGLIQTSLVYASLYLGLISVNRVFMRCYKFHFQKRVSMEAHVRLPCGFHRPPRSLCVLAVCHGKISETNKSLGRHPSVLKNTSESCGLWWEGVAQRWRNYLFTLALSENKKNKKKKRELFPPRNGRQINKYSWADNVGRSEPPAVVQRHAGLGMRRRVTLWGSSPQHHHHHHHCHHRYHWGSAERGADMNPASEESNAGYV